MAKVVGGLPPALDFMFGSFYRNFVSKKTLNHGIGSAINFTRASNATFFDADGTLKIAGTNVPRFDHDPATGESRGLLVEESRTNLFARSADFDNAYWTKVESSTHANSITAVDGQLAADKIIESSLLAKHFIKKHITGDQGISSVGESITGSIFLKASERSKALLILKSTGIGDTDSSGDLHGECLFNLLNGQIDSVTNLSSLNLGVVRGSISVRSVDVGDGWYRCIITVTIVSAAPRPGGWRFEVVLHNGTSISYTGDGTSGIFAWGAQLEADAFATSYIPTTTAAATRAADSAVVTPISSFYNQVEGTVFAEYAGAHGNRGVLQFNNNTNDERIGIITSDNSTPFLSAVSGATSQAVIGVGSVPQIQDVIKFAGAFKRNDFQAARGGTLGVADTSGNMPAAQSTHCYIGSIALGGNNANCHIRKIAYWPKRLPDTLLRQLTT